MLNASTRDQYHTLLDAITLTEADDQPAIIFVATDAEPITITRRAFKAQITNCAMALRGIGIAPRDLVIIAHTQNLESIYAFWGALWLGAIPSMFPTLTEKLDPDFYINNLAELTRFSNVRVVLTTDDFAPTLSARLPCTVYGTSAWLNMSVEESLPICDNKAKETSGLQADDLPSPRLRGRGVGGEDITAFLQHSSGTTGLQKGVALSHRAVLNQLAHYADAIMLNDQDVIVSWLPLYHDMGLIAGFILPLVTGLPLVLMSPFDWVQHPALLLKAIHDYRGTLCWLPNFAYNHLARRVRVRDSDRLDLSSIRAFINCSEPARHASHTLFAERFAANGVSMKQLAVSYAMAENTFAVSQTAVGEAAKLDTIDREALQRDLIAAPAAPDSDDALTQVSCGKPITGTAVKVVNEAGDSVGERQIGELLVKSDCMLTEYFMRHDLQPFDSDGWYKTGDRGYIAVGEIFVVGRSKDLIISAGKNIYPQDVEAILYEIDGIHAGRAVVFGVPDEREGTELVAVVAEVDTYDQEALRQIQLAIRQQIARATEVSVSYVSLVERGWLIKTSSGKTARAANRAKWLAERENQGNLV
jgi:acyl-CoA synthetase (AMP-forming)/AMP-acid ligase II